MHLFKLSLRKDVFQLSQGAYAPLSLFLTVIYFSSQLRLSSMLIPKYFVFFIHFIASVLITRSGNSFNFFHVTYKHKFAFACIQTKFA